MIFTKESGKQTGPLKHLFSIFMNWLTASCQPFSDLFQNHPTPDGQVFGPQPFLHFMALSYILV
jgi:hypothetical protein